MTSTLSLTRDGVYRSREPMTVENLQRAAPAALAVEAHASRSDLYRPIPTMLVVEALRRSVGVEVFGATQARTRTGSRDHTKHVLRLRRPADEGNEVPELLLTNSYDGSSSYQLKLGCYRFVCANGLVVGDTWDEARVRHIGEDAIEQMVDETRRLAGQFDNIRDTISSMKAIRLEQDEAVAFAGAALLLRHDAEEVESGGVVAESLLTSRRQADKAPDLWTTFNRIQEHATRGGYWKHSRDERTGRVKSQRVRAVKGIDGNKSLNAALWTLAESMKALKS